MPHLHEINIKCLDIEVAPREFFDHLGRLHVLVVDQPLGRATADGSASDRLLVVERMDRLLVRHGADPCERQLGLLVHHLLHEARLLLQSVLLKLDVLHEHFFILVLLLLPNIIILLLDVFLNLDYVVHDFGLLLSSTLIDRVGQRIQVWRLLRMNCQILLVLAVPVPLRTLWQKSVINEGCFGAPHIWSHSLIHPRHTLPVIIHER